MKKFGYKSWFYENDFFMLKAAENLPARGRKTEMNITLALLLILTFNILNWFLTCSFSYT
jgi:hypothetical protein